MNNTTPPTAPGPKRFASVRDLVKDTAVDDGQIREFDRRIKGTTVVNALIRGRAAAAMTQADVAQCMGCTQSAVSKLEHSCDSELTLGDIASYLKSTNNRLSMQIGRPASRVERIKELAVGLKHELEALADLSSSSDDHDIRQNIKGFFGEAWFNLFNILCAATSRLPMEPDELSPLISLADASFVPPLPTGRHDCAPGR